MARALSSFIQAKLYVHAASSYYFQITDVIGGAQYTETLMNNYETFFFKIFVHI